MNSLGRLILTWSVLGLIFFAATPSFATVVDSLADGPLGPSNTHCTLMQAGQTCSLDVTSSRFPIALINMGTGTDGSYGLGKPGLLGIGGNGPNGAWTDDVPGLFIDENSGTTPLKFVPPGATDIPTDAAPEPRALAALALVAILIGSVVIKRRRQASPPRS